LAEQPMVKEGASQLNPNGTVNQCCSDRRVHSTRQSANHMTIADFVFDVLNCRFKDAYGIPGRGYASRFIKESLDHLLTVSGMDYFRMPLNPIKTLVDILEGGDRRIRS